MERQLNVILNNINTTIKTVGGFGSKIITYGLCYQQKKDDKTFPLLNTGGGQGKIIDWDDKEHLRVYHRIVGEVKEEADKAQGFGAKPSKVRIYPMRAVFVGTRKALTTATFEDNEDLARQVSNTFPNFLSGKEVIIIEELEVNKNTVYEEEYEGVDMKALTLAGIAFWITYTIRSKIC